MTTNTASCRCGQLRAVATGAPARVSVCHCLSCKKRSGSALSAQVRFPTVQVAIEGRSNTFETVADSGNRATYHFCPQCGSDVYYVNHGKFDGLVAIPLGAFDNPFTFTPNFSVWEKRKCAWVEVVGEAIEHID